MNIGFIGCGKMATALVRGILKADTFTASNIVVADRYASAAKALAEECKVTCLPDGKSVSEQSEVVVLCVKPADASEVFGQIGDALDGKLVISILAGTTLEALEHMAGAKVRLARVMPNTPALVHKGASAYALGSSATPQDAEMVEKLLGSAGLVYRVKEELLDAVTGLSGSGPAYIYVVIEAMADAGVLMGLPRDMALQLAAQTVAGAAEMVLQTGSHPAQLKDMVTSPGGTTIAALESMEKDGVRAAFFKAVRAATEKARLLGGKK